MYTIINMNERLKQQFEEQLTYLPAINQQALRSFDWATELVAIGKNYGLHIDELEDLQTETMLLLVGLITAEQYPNEIINRLAISPAEAEKIIEQVNDRIFIPIHDYIVNGGVTQASTPTTIMQSAGFEMTKDDSPVPTSPDTMIRMGGTTPVTQSIPESKPTPTITTSPLQFHPVAENSTQPIVPEIVAIPVPKPPTLTLSKDKLEQVTQNRQKIVDATLQSMDQVS